MNRHVRTLVTLGLVAIVADVHWHLMAMAEEMIGKYGADITRW